jgi:hypothetical protein
MTTTATNVKTNSTQGISSSTILEPAIFGPLLSHLRPKDLQSLASTSRSLHQAVFEHAKSHLRFDPSQAFAANHRTTLLEKAYAHGLLLKEAATGAAREVIALGRSWKVFATTAACTTTATLPVAALAVALTTSKPLNEIGFVLQQGIEGANMTATLLGGIAILAAAGTTIVSLLQRQSITATATAICTTIRGLITDFARVPIPTAFLSAASSIAIQAFRMAIGMKPAATEGKIYLETTAAIAACAGALAIVGSGAMGRALARIAKKRGSKYLIRAVLQNDLLSLPAAEQTLALDNYQRATPKGLKRFSRIMLEQLIQSQLPLSREYPLIDQFYDEVVQLRADYEQLCGGEKRSLHLQDNPLPTMSENMQKFILRARYLAKQIMSRDLASDHPFLPTNVAACAREFRF